MEFQAIQKKKKIYQTIIDQIKHSIAEGTIQPGDKLPSERALATMFKVSRTSVKEAMTVLESSGIITVRPGVGMYVNTEANYGTLLEFSNVIGDNLYDFMNLIELRQTIEGDAAFYAAKRITKPQKERLESDYENLVALSLEGKIAMKEDYQFHYTIVEAANNPVMLEIIKLVADKILIHLRESRAYSITDDSLNAQVIEEHKQIFRAIIEGRPGAAKEAMWKHHQGIKLRHQQFCINSGGIRNDS